MKRFLTFLILLIVVGAIFAQQNCPPSMTNYWKLDEATGPPYADFFGADDAQSINPPLVTDGICGNAQLFNEGNQEVDVPVSENFNWGIDDNFTIEYWLKSTTGSSGYRVAVGRDGDYPNLHWWSGIWEDGTAAFMLFATNGGADGIRGTTVLSAETWYHITCIRDADADSIYLFVNGVKEASRRVVYSAGFESSEAKLNIGYLDLHDGYHFNGAIDEIALYNDALTENEIQTHYTNGLAGLCYCDGNSGSDPEYVLLADKEIKLKRQMNSVGNIHSNGKISYESNKYWWNGIHTGDISAVDKIKVKKGNTIIGNAIAGKDINVDGRSEITGSVTENTFVESIEIPTQEFNAGGDNVYVSFNRIKELEPGSYGKVRVRWLGKLKLTAGDYYFKSLDIDFYSKILADVTDGPVNVYVTGKIDLGAKSVVKVFPESEEALPESEEASRKALPESEEASRKLTFNTLHKGSFKFGSFGVYEGNFIAPKGDVKIGYYSRIKGSITAEKIKIERGTQFVPHGYTQPFAKQPDMDTIEDENESNMVVEEYALNQNYPNPFNPSTTLSFTLPEAGNVNLTIYDLLGQKVVTLIDDNMSAGYHSAVFNANNLPSGIYIYRLVSENFRETKKMQLLK